MMDASFFFIKLMKNKKKHIEHNWNTLNELVSNEDILLELSKTLNPIAKKKRNDVIKSLEKEERKNYKQFYIPLKRLKFLSGQNNIQKQYNSIDISKKRGGVRTLNIPSKRLRFVQRLILDFLTNNFKPHKTAYGFIEKKSIVDNAKLHKNKKYVICFDIKDFFPTINSKRIYGMLQSYPFNANANVARIITNYVTYYDYKIEAKILPQGAPTSPYLANMICRKMDSRIFNFFKSKSVNYSRYADDLTFSTNDFKKIHLIMKNVPRFIAEEGFKVNEEKTRVLPYYKRQIVTGLVINKKVSLPREYIRGLRALLHNVEKYGWESQVKRNRLFFDEGEYIEYLNYQKDLDFDQSEDKVNKLTKLQFDTYNKLQKDEHLLVHSKNYINLRLKNENYTPIDMLKMIVKGKIEFLGMVRNIRDKEGKIIKIDKFYKNIKDKFELLNLIQDENDFSMIELIKKINGYAKTNLKDREEVVKSLSSIKEEMKEYKGKSTNKELIKLLDATFLKYYNVISNKIHSPKILSEILGEFRYDSELFMFITHPWDGVKYQNNTNYEQFISDIKKKWDNFNEKLFDMYPEIGAKIYNFLLSKSPSWLTYQLENKEIKLGWNSEELRKWISANPDRKPQEYPLPLEIENIHGETISTFNDLVEIFKNEIEFRDGVLRNIFDLIEKKYDDLEFKYLNEFENDYTIYTDVYWLKDALEIILKSIQDRKNNSNKVSISSFDESDKLIISILHKNSYADKSITDPKFDGGGTIQNILKKLTNICDWSIESRFKDGYRRINYLSINNNEKIVEISPLDGFKHILTFYKVKKNG